MRNLGLGFRPASKVTPAGDRCSAGVLPAPAGRDYWMVAEPVLLDFTGLEPGSCAMVLVRQATEASRSWQIVWDLAISPFSLAMAMALPLRLLLPCTAERVFTSSPAAEAPMPMAWELEVGLLETAPV